MMHLKLELGVQHNVEESTRLYLGDAVHRYGNSNQQPRRQHAEYLQTSGAQEKPTATAVQVAQFYSTCATNLNVKTIKQQNTKT